MAEMEILYANNAGSGFAGKKIVEEGITLGELFKSDLPRENMGKYLIKVDGQEVKDENLVITEKQKVSVTPSKMEGAG